MFGRNKVKEEKKTGATHVKKMRCSTEYRHSSRQADDEAHLKPTVCFFCNANGPREIDTTVDIA